MFTVTNLNKMLQLLFLLNDVLLYFYIHYQSTSLASMLKVLKNHLFPLEIKLLL